MGMSERLERVRETTGAANLREFWKGLLERTPDDYSVSYEAVRNYHSGRDAPVSYLTAVAKAFGFRLEWLASGEGPRTEEEARSIAGSAALSATIAEDAKEALVDLHSTVLRAIRAPVDYHPRHWGPSLAAVLRRANDAPPFPARTEIRPEHIGRALGAALEAIGVDPSRTTHEWMDDYITAMAPVLLMLAAERQRQGEYAPEPTEV